MKMPVDIASYMCGQLPTLADLPPPPTAPLANPQVTT